MSISSVTAQFQSPYSQARAQSAPRALDALRHSLNTDDLAGARRAFASLQQSFGGTLQARSGNGSPLQRDLAALGRSLRAGELAGAKHNMTAVLQDLQAAQAPGSSAKSDADGDSDRGTSGQGINVTA